MPSTSIRNLDECIHHLNDIKNMLEPPTSFNESNSNYETIEKEDHLNQQEESVKLFSELNVDCDLSSFLKDLNNWEEYREQKLKSDLTHYKSSLNKSSSCITSEKFNKLKLQWCNTLEEHQKFIIENKSLLSWYLEQSNNSNSLTIHHSQQRNLKELLHNYISTLNKLPQDVQCLQINREDYLTKSNEMLQSLAKLSNNIKHSLSDVENLQRKLTN